MKLIIYLTSGLPGGVIKLIYNKYTPQFDCLDNQDGMIFCI